MTDPATTEQDPLTKLQAIRDSAWSAGILRWKIVNDATQLALYERIKSCPGKAFITEGARKLGKSFLHGVIALETALQNPGKQVNWVTATQKACRGTLLFILEEISTDAPTDCKGRYDHENGRWLLPNGAYIQLVGAETKKDCEKARGPSSILTIFDEAGFIDLLEYMLDSVLKPQMRRIRRLVGSFVGLVLSVSTTPYTPSHYFCRLADLADSRGAYQQLTVFDSGFETAEQIEDFIASEAAEKGLSVEAFKATSTFRREYLSIRVIDEDAVVFSEFHDAELRKRIVIPHARPPGFERYVQKRTAIDLGMRDKTALLFGYVDFLAGKFIIEGEALLEKPNTKTIALVIAFMEGEEIYDAATKEMRPINDAERAELHALTVSGKAVLHPLEGNLWAGADKFKTSRAVDDPQGRVVLDLWDLQKVRTDKAVKHDREASIGIVRAAMPAERLLINPRCIELVRQLKEAMRSKSKKDFAHEDPNNERGGGHYDLCAALMYFVRGLSLTHNPYPPDFDYVTGAVRPATHPLVQRRVEAGRQHQTGLTAGLLGQNRYVGRGRR